MGDSKIPASDRVMGNIPITSHYCVALYLVRPQASGRTPPDLEAYCLIPDVGDGEISAYSGPQFAWNTVIHAESGCLSREIQ